MKAAAWFLALGVVVVGAQVLTCAAWLLGALLGLPR